MPITPKTGSLFHAETHTYDPSVGARLVIANSGSGRAEIVESYVELQFIENVVILPLHVTEGANVIGKRP